MTQAHGPSASPAPLQVALLGNPNTGKTTLFNALSGLRHKTGNYPGVTVEVRKGTVRAIHDGAPRDLELLDLPGTYSLAARSPDELLAVEVVTGGFGASARPDVLLCMADASNLERSLYLFSQAVELGVPVVIALTMGDLAEKQGIRVDTARLSRQLGMPVVPVNAPKIRVWILSNPRWFPPPLGKTFPVSKCCRNRCASFKTAWRKPGIAIQASS